MAQSGATTAVLSRATRGDRSRAKSPRLLLVRTRCRIQKDARVIGGAMVKEVGLWQTGSVGR